MAYRRRRRFQSRCHTLHLVPRATWGWEPESTGRQTFRGLPKTWAGLLVTSTDAQSLGSLVFVLAPFLSRGGWIRARLSERRLQVDRVRRRRNLCREA